MATPLSTEPMPAEQSALLADFARTCKAAARAVSLYPGTHPAIASSLMRLVAASARLAHDGPITFVVHRDMLVIDGRSPVRPDASIGELASLLHERLIGAVTVWREADAEDWRALLLLLARPPEDLMARGGIAQAWIDTGRAHFDIREIDYAEVLREKGGRDDAEWDRIIAHCLRGEAPALDDRALASLLDALGDPARFGELLERIQAWPESEATKVSTRIAALLQLMRTAIDAARTRGETDADRALETIAASCACLTPDMMVGMLERRHSEHADAPTAASVIERMTDATVASFMARSVTAQRGGSERLAQALEGLAHATDRKARIVQLAKDEAGQGELGLEDGFEEVWDNVANLVMSYSMVSYSDESFVSEQYGRELSAARKQALEVERVSDDPPERVQAWVATVSDSALQQLDLEMLTDLLRIEGDLVHWEPVATVVVAEAERRTLAGDTTSAHTLVEAIARDSAFDGRAELRTSATKLMDRLAGGPLARHIGLQFRTVDDQEVDRLSHVCHLLGPRVVRSLADALSREEDPTAVRRLGALLLSFGPAGRRSVEQLKNSSNPAVRRTAVTLLRSAGGQEALTELASMLGDADPEVQRESIRAIVEIGTASAYAVLNRLVLEADTPRDTALRELVGLRDDKAVPLFCYVVSKGHPRGTLFNVQLSMIEALGTMKPRPESARALQQVLQRGQWWTPFRTAALRHAAATALRRLGTPEALAVLESAASSGSWGVRKLARTQLATVPHREKNRT